MKRSIVGALASAALFAVVQPSIRYSQDNDTSLPTLSVVFSAATAAELGIPLRHRRARHGYRYSGLYHPYCNGPYTGGGWNGGTYYGGPWIDFRCYGAVD
jgi:hypothetical protein